MPLAVSPSSAAEILVPLSRVSAFVRLLTHDVRNNLNSMDLQAAFAAELITDPEAAEEVKRIRGLIHDSARALQALSGNFWTSSPSLIPYTASIFVEDLRDRLAKLHPEAAPQVEWTVALGEENILIDIEMIFSALAEIFKNAFQFREKGQGIAARVWVESGRFSFELREGKTSVPSAPESWGAEPFVSTRRGGYGLGLFRARALLAAHGGDLGFTFEPGSNLLLTRATLPVL